MPVVYEHWAQSGFANTDLDAQLKQHGVSKIVLIGTIASARRGSPESWIESATIEQTELTPLVCFA
jgi:Isochorismatase family